MTEPNKRKRTSMTCPFVTNNTIQDFSIQSLSEIKPGDHICGIFQNQEDQIFNVVQFLLHGLQSNDKILYIEEDPNVKAQVLEGLSNYLNVSEKLASEQLVLATANESYLTSGVFIWEDMIKLLTNMLNEASKNGYHCLRVTAEPTWILNYPYEIGFQQFLHYERQVNKFFNETNSLALCQYSMNRWKSSFLIEILAAHPSSLVGKELFHNFYYVPPMDIPEDLNARTLCRLLKNIEDRKRTEQSLIQAREQAIATLKSKSKFFAIITHEMRTALNGIIGMTDVLLAMNQTTDSRGCIETVKSSGAHLLSVINSVLDNSRFESGQAQLELIPCDLVKIVRESISICNPSAKKKGLDIFHQVPQQEVPVVKGDPVKLRQILINLIGNSIKFTSRSPITVELSVNRVDDLSIMALFRVTDLGIGIPQQAYDTIFDHFTQADASTSRIYGGTGLGLSICKSLTNLMGGNIDFDSILNEGTTFRVRIPFEISNEEIVSSPSSDLHDTSDTDVNGAYSDIRVLAAEDNHINQKVLTRMLQRFGITPRIVPDGLQAVHALKEKTYDVLFLDMHMPCCDGWIATEMIRNDHSIPQPYIVALTGVPMENDLVSNLWDEYILKPITLKQMENTLERYRKKKELTSNPESDRTNRIETL